MDKNLFVYLQTSGEGLHPISQNIITTARALGEEGNLTCTGVLFCRKLAQKLRKALERTQLHRIVVYEAEWGDVFLPQAQLKYLSRLLEENSEIFLVPATPEGRCISSMVGTMLHTGVTADCTSLSVDRDGRFVQTRPAFSGNVMADIVTEHSKPQIASLRFGRSIADCGMIPEIEVIPASADQTMFSAQWLDHSDSGREKKHRLVLAVGAGIQEKGDLSLFEEICRQTGAELRCSRVLIDRGWMPRSHQIGLSGCCISADLLITFGISGSVQFCAGLDHIGHLVAINQDADAPIMKLADTPIQGDLYQIVRLLIKK